MPARTDTAFQRVSAPKYKWRAFGAFFQSTGNLLGLGGPVSGSLKSHAAQDNALRLWKESDSCEKLREQRLEGRSGLDALIRDPGSWG